MKLAISLKHAGPEGLSDAIVELQLEKEGRTVAAVEWPLRRQDVKLWAKLLNPPDTVTSEEELANLGKRLGDLLGEDMRRGLGLEDEDPNYDTLDVVIAAASKDPLAAALARFPWELATSPVTHVSLVKRNVAVRFSFTGARPLPRANFQDRQGRPLKVLLVFAQGQDSVPLALRREREMLLKLFHDRVLPERQVHVDVLCHGVSERTLASMVTNAGGYDCIHWSGHGTRDFLELEESGLTSKQLVEFVIAHATFTPRLVFLSACHSGSIVTGQEARALLLDLALARTGRRSPGTEPPTPGKISEVVNRRQGLTGAGLGLLAAGVPQVVAMRYGVSDEYARELARKFYALLAADRESFRPEEALAHARMELRDGQYADRFSPVDHLTPLLLWGRDVEITVPEGRSNQLDEWEPRSAIPDQLQPCDGFVGRTVALKRLACQWLPLQTGDETGELPIGTALVTGPEGVGKTALVAEAISLWHRHFHVVPTVLVKRRLDVVKDFYLPVHEALKSFDQYCVRCEKNERDAVYLEPRPRLPAPEALRQMRRNFGTVLKSYRLLVVVDGHDRGDEQADVPSRELNPEWDDLLTFMADTMPATGSRLLLAARSVPRALADRGRVLKLQLEPFSEAETALFIRTSRRLRPLLIDQPVELIAEPLLAISSPKRLRELESCESFAGLQASLRTPGERHEQTPTLSPGTVLNGRYAIRRLLGKGGMGEVYEADDPIAKDIVALKIMSAPPALGERFVLEAQTARRLSKLSEHFVRVHDLCPDARPPFFTMEYLEGESLDASLQRREPMDETKLIALTLQVCDALAAAHREQTFHRDIKPANLFLCRDGRLKVLDLGIAKVTGNGHTTTGQALGSAGYAAPEQFNDARHVDGRADIFSVGVTFLRLATGDADAGTSEAEQHPWQHPALRKVISTCLQSEPSKRYQKIGDLREALEAAVRRVPFPEPKPPVDDPLRSSGGTGPSNAPKPSSGENGTYPPGLEVSTVAGGANETKTPNATDPTPPIIEKNPDLIPPFPPQRPGRARIPAAVGLSTMLAALAVVGGLLNVKRSIDPQPAVSGSVENRTTSIPEVFQPDIYLVDSKSGTCSRYLKRILAADGAWWKKHAGEPWPENRNARELLAKAAFGDTTTVAPAPPNSAAPDPACRLLLPTVLLKEQSSARISLPPNPILEVPETIIQKGPQKIRVAVKNRSFVLFKPTNQTAAQFCQQLESKNLTVTVVNPDRLESETAVIHDCSVELPFGFGWSDAAGAGGRASASVTQDRVGCLRVTKKSFATDFQLAAECAPASGDTCYTDCEPVCAKRCL